MMFGRIPLSSIRIRNLRTNFSFPLSSSWLASQYSLTQTIQSGVLEALTLTCPHASKSQGPFSAERGCKRGFEEKNGRSRIPRPNACIRPMAAYPCPLCIAFFLINSLVRVEWAGSAQSRPYELPPSHVNAHTRPVPMSNPILSLCFVFRHSPPPSTCGQRQGLSSRLLVFSLPLSLSLSWSLSLSLTVLVDDV